LTKVKQRRDKEFVDPKPFDVRILKTMKCPRKECRQPVVLDGLYYFGERVRCLICGWSQCIPDSVLEDFVDRKGKRNARFECNVS
jgi:hypothetical protein